jgi:ATP-binding cassette subfamily B protein
LTSKAKEVLRVFSVTRKVVALAFQAHPGYAITILVCQIVNGVVPVCQLIVFKIFIDALIKATAHDSVTPMSSVASLQQMYVTAGTPLIIGIFLAILYVICLAVRPLIEDELREMLTLKIQMLILEKTRSFHGLYLFEKPEFYDLLRKSQSEIGWRPQVILNGLSNLVTDILGLFAMVAVIVSFQPLLLILLAICAVPNLIVQFVHGYENWKLFEYDNADRRRLDYYTNLLTDKEHAKEVRMFGLGGFFVGRFEFLFGQFRARHLSLVLTQLRRTSILAGISFIGGGAAWLYIVARAIAGSITIGSLVLYGQALASALAHVNSLLWNLGRVYEGDLYATNLFAFLALEEPLIEQAEGAGTAPPATLSRGIEFRNVDFGYTKDQNVLKDLSFTIAPGQTFALVGENGAGKTTIVKLLCRLYDPTGGQILVDGVDVRKFDLEQWRSMIAVVFQDYCQYHMTAGENIGIGRVDFIENKELIVKAAQCGGASSIVDKLPSKYDTMLGRFLPGKDEGAELSGGEWQRIALARAFMRSNSKNGNNGNEGLAAPPAVTKSGDESPQDAKAQVSSGANGERPAAPAEAQILILDEPTSAFDVQSEHDVFERFTTLTHGKTSLLISHRFSTVKMADVILVLQDGRIIEQGNHQSLMSMKDGVYAGLYSLQADRYT